MVETKQNNKIQLHLVNHRGGPGAVISPEVIRNSLQLNIYVSVLNKTYVLEKSSP